MGKIVRENSFEGAPGGSSGTLNYSVGYGTPAGGGYRQDPSKFQNSDQSAGHSENQGTGSGVNPLPERPDRIPPNRASSSGGTIKPGDMALQGGKSQPGKNPKAPNTINFGSGGKLPSNGKSVTDFPSDEDGSGSEDYYPNGGPDTDNETNPNNSQIPGKDDSTSPGGKYQNAVANKDANPDNKEFDKDVDQMFQKKITPTPDELMSALQYELNNMVRKDKYIAKSIVLKNLKTDPKYYTRLNMLNIDDDKMKVDEATVAKTKAVLDTMIAERKAQSQSQVLGESPEISAIFKDLWDRRRGNPNDKK